MRKTIITTLCVFICFILVACSESNTNEIIDNNHFQTETQTQVENHIEEETDNTSENNPTTQTQTTEPSNDIPDINTDETQEGNMKIKLIIEDNAVPNKTRSKISRNKKNISASDIYQPTIAT